MGFVAVCGGASALPFLLIGLGGAGFDLYAATDVVLRPLLLIALPLAFGLCGLPMLHLAGKAWRRP